MGNKEDCDENGQCDCKVGFSDKKCNHCKPGYIPEKKCNKCDVKYYGYPNCKGKLVDQNEKSSNPISNS